MLIGCLIVLLTIIQLVLVNWIEKNIAKEVDFKARNYSEQVLELAVNEWDSVAQLPIIIKQSTSGDIQKTKLKKLKSVNNVEVYSLGNEHLVELLTDKIEDKQVASIHDKEKHASIQEQQATQLGRKILHREFKTLVEKIHNEKNKVLNPNKTISNTIVIDSPNVLTRTWVSDTLPSSSKNLFNRIQITLVIVGLLGLVFAYWLSIKFNKPLKQLTDGFQQLAQGEYQHQVKEQGVGEIRATIKLFNQMVKRLQQLSTAEKQHKEIAHLAELGEVSRGLAHALRNPIHTIGLSIEQLSDDHLSEQQKTKLIKTMQNKIANIDKNIKGLLTLTTTGINREDKVPLLAVIQDIMLEYKSYQNKDIAFEISVDKNIQVTGAESEIRSILHTLINNACEANDSHSKVIIKSIIHKNTNIDIIVQDQGKGIDEHIQDQLFQPHVSTKPEGAGMGLYIAQRLISLHYQGNISLANHVNQNQQTDGCIAVAQFGHC
jgi:signal transduction histidine kinase